MTGIELSALVDRVKALEEASDHVVGISEKTTIRARINHTHTREGWKLAETTVEWHGFGSPNWEQIEAEMAKAHEVGLREANARNLGEREAAANSAADEAATS